jgi:DNA-binding NtrC family response regulator
VRPAATVAEARALAADPAAGIDLLLTDVVLADGTGIELAAEMRAAHPRLPILLMSGYAAPGLLPEDDDDPRRDLLQKPFSPDELGRSVRRLLDLA